MSKAEDRCSEKLNSFSTVRSQRSTVHNSPRNTQKMSNMLPCSPRNQTHKPHYGPSDQLGRSGRWTRNPSGPAVAGELLYNVLSLEAIVFSSAGSSIERSLADRNHSPFFFDLRSSDPWFAWHLVHFSPSLFLVITFPVLDRYFFLAGHLVWS